MFVVEYLLLPASATPHSVPAGRPVCVMVMVEVPVVIGEELNVMGTVTFEPVIATVPDGVEAVHPLESAQTLYEYTPFGTFVNVIVDAEE